MNECGTYNPQFRNKFSEGGFKRLVGNGYNFSNNPFNYVPTKTGKTNYVFEDSIVQTVGASDNVGQRTLAYLLSTPVIDEINNPLGKPRDIQRKRPIFFMKASGFQPFLFYPEAEPSGNSLIKIITANAKVMGNSIKDRAAILPAGQAADGTFGTTMIRDTL